MRLEAFDRSNDSDVGSVLSGGAVGTLRASKTVLPSEIIALAQVAKKKGAIEVQFVISQSTNSRHRRVPDQAYPPQRDRPLESAIAG